MQVIAVKTFNSRKLGLVRTGSGPHTLDEAYGKDLIRHGLVRRHEPDVQAVQEAPSNAAVRNPPRTPETPPGPSQADPRRPGRAGGSATNSSGRRRGGGAARQS